jgi:hypothetical protein
MPVLVLVQKYRAVGGAVLEEKKERKETARTYLVQATLDLGK